MKKEWIMIQDFPDDERPRERLLSFGANHLSNNELLAILLRTGTKEESVLQLANRILHKYDGLHLMNQATVEELTSIKGIGMAKAIQIMAALEIGRRVANLHVTDRYVVRSPEDGANYVMEEMRHLSQEHFVCLFLNTKNQVLLKKTIFIGSLNSSIVHPRDIFREALRRSAASIICIHNHPSGSPEPSKEDIEVTKRLKECGILMGIDILDHIIIGDRKFVSLREKGYV